MSTSRKLTTFLAVGAIGLGSGFVAAPAFSHNKADDAPSKSDEAAKGGAHDADKAERRAARRAERVSRKRGNRAFRREMRTTRRMSRHVMRHCEIAPERLLTTETSRRLDLIRQLLDLRVADGDISQEHSNAIFEYRQMRVTLRTAAKAAKYAPMMKLFGVSTRKELRDAVRAAGGKRALMKNTGISKMDYRAAKREGMIDRFQVVVDLCNSGSGMPDKAKPGEAPKDELPANGESETEASKGEQHSPSDGQAGASKG